MPSGVSAAIDKRLEHVVVAWARHRWPPLRVIPARWLQPVVAPTARRIRRLLTRAVLATAISVGIIIALAI
jgi:hypothetical protein